jgi:hypothetical protein
VRLVGFAPALIAFLLVVEENFAPSSCLLLGGGTARSAHVQVVIVRERALEFGIWSH